MYLEFVNDIGIRTIVFLVVFQLCFVLQAQDDCIFNNDYKSLTLSWIDDSGTGINFLWDEDAKAYQGNLNDDESIWLSRGGCHHFVTNLTYKTTKNISLNDHEFWLAKSLDLAQKFSLEFFIQPIKAGLVKLDFERENLRIYTFPLNGEETVVSEGIIVEQDGLVKSLILSYYLN